jgi:hypothetical protein
MALVFFDGFQDCAILPKNEWSGAAGFYTPVAGRDGSANGALNLRNTGGPTTRTLTPSSGPAVCICGCAAANVLGGTFSTMTFHDNAATRQIWVGLNGAGFIEVHRTDKAGALLGTSSEHTAIGSEWHYYEYKVVLNAAGAGMVVVRLDGVQVLNLTGITTSSLTSNVRYLSMFQSSSTGTSAQYDDMYVCDDTDGTATQGRANNDFLGDVRVASLYPTSAGDSTGWTPSTGANWSCVDETTPSTTDYVSILSTSTGTRDLYNVTDLAASVALVYGVRVSLYALKSDAGAALVKPVLKENGVVTASVAQGLSTAAAAVHGPMIMAKPSDGSVFAPSDVNALQIGVEVG